MVDMDSLMIMSVNNSMQLYTKRSLSSNSELTVSPLTGEDIYVTPWTDDWLTSEFKLTGDLLKYFGANKVPKIRPMTSQEETEYSSVEGWYSPFFCTIVFKNSNEGMSTVVHEIQHALQALDGRSGGGNSDSFKKGAELITRASNPLSKLIVIPKEFWSPAMLELEASYRKFSAWRHSQSEHRYPAWLASKMYRHIIGEIEARMAEGSVGPLDESFIHSGLNACQVAAQSVGIRPYHMELIMGNGDDILDRNIQEVITKYEIFCEEKRAEDKARLARIKAEQALAWVGTKEERLEEYFWSRLGDEYRLPKSKKRTNYKKRAI